MKHIYIFFIWLIFPIISFAQNIDSKADFEGVITYTLQIESTNPTISTRDLQKMFGDTMKLYIKKDNYKMVFDGSYAREILYLGTENKHYISLGQIDSMVWRYCNENASSAIYTQAYKNADRVMNYDCDAYTIQTDWGSTTYYYAPQIKMNPKNYSHHVFNYFNVYVKYAKSPYLKYVYNGPTFRMTLVATDILAHPVEQTAFNAVWKQPYASINPEAPEK